MAKRSLAVAIVALALSAGSGSAQQYIYYNACGAAEGTSLRVCGSADVFLTGSTLTMRVWNMEVAGASGISSYASEFGGWHTITAVGLEYTGSNHGGWGMLEGAKYVFGENEADFTMLNYWRGVDDGGRNPLKVQLGSSTGSQQEGIIGCTDPSAGRGTYVQTCGSYGFMPFAEFTFTVDPAIALKHYNFEFFGQQIAGGYGAKVSGSGVPTEVVPEPVTMLLMGTGLAGIGGAGWRRRRKDSMV